MDIKQALASLDPSDDEVWTDDGLPRVDAVAEIMDEQVTRQQITDADPMLSRSSAPDMVAAAEDTIPIVEEVMPVAEAPPIVEDVGGLTDLPAERDANGDLVPSEIKVNEPEPEQAQPAPDPIKMTDADRSACVEILDDVVGMKPADVFRSLELCGRASAEFARMTDVLSARREAIAKKITEVGSRSAIITNAINRLGGSTDRSQEDRRAYLKSQNDIRAKRKSAAVAFLAAGTNAEDVATELRGASPLDAALNARQKPAIGSQRPAPRLPA